MEVHCSNATGHNDGPDEPIPVEESGNNLIAALNYTRKTRDKSMITRFVRAISAWPPSTVLKRARFQSELLNQWIQFVSGPEISIRLLLR